MFETTRLLATVIMIVSKHENIKTIEVFVVLFYKQVPIFLRVCVAFLLLCLTMVSLGLRLKSLGDAVSPTRSPGYIPLPMHLSNASAVQLSENPSSLCFMVQLWERVLWAAVCSLEDRAGGQVTSGSI